MGIVLEGVFCLLDLIFFQLLWLIMTTGNHWDFILSSKIIITVVVILLELIIFIIITITIDIIMCFQHHNNNHHYTICNGVRTVFNIFLIF